MTLSSSQQANVVLVKAIIFMKKEKRAGELAWKLDETKNMREIDKIIASRLKEVYRDSPALNNAKNQVRETIKTKLIEPRLQMLDLKPIEVTDLEEHEENVYVHHEIMQIEYGLIN